MEMINILYKSLNANKYIFNNLKTELTSWVEMFSLFHLGKKMLY